jgi:ABC-type nitrate/sulfonate/bicarbonate transport system substrate-binding protein
MTALTLGFMPLTDCAPLVVARDKGFFAQEGLDVTLSREASWATIRDKLAFGTLDAAQLLAPMAIASPLGIGGEAAMMVAPMALSRGGGAITVSRALAAQIRSREATGDTSPLAGALAAQAGVPTFAVVFPYSIHNYALRGWLAGAGVDPDRDVRIIVVPPARMAQQLAAGLIEGFCAGAPWNAVAAAAGAGETVATTAALHPGAPDKVLGLAEARAGRDPPALAALLRALSRAGAWADQADNRDELIALLARPEVVGVGPSVIAPALDGEIVFQADGAAAPRPEDTHWILSQMRRWGQLGPDPRLAAPAGLVYRPDLLRQALAAG